MYVDEGGSMGATPAQPAAPPPPGGTDPAVTQFAAGLKAQNAQAPVVTANAGYSPTTDEFLSMLQGSPMYKQGVEAITNAANTAIQNNNDMLALQSQINNTSTFVPTPFTPEQWIPIEIPQAYYIQQQNAKDKAAHDYALQQKAIPEIMAARGMLSSGQTGFEQTEATYSFDQLNKDIDTAKLLHEQEVALENKRGEAQVAQSNAARAAQIAASNAAGAAAAAQANQNAAIQKQIMALGVQQQNQQITTQLATDRYNVLVQTAGFYKDLWFDPQTGQYRGPGATEPTVTTTYASPQQGAIAADPASAAYYAAHPNETLFVPSPSVDFSTIPTYGVSAPITLSPNFMAGG